MNRIKIHFIVDLDDAGSNFSPNFGIGYLSSYLKGKIENIETSLSLLSDDIMADISRIKPDIIGISCTSRHFTQLRILSLELKRNFDLPIVWGGVHISLAPNELPTSCDIGVMGEGEETLTELVENYSNGKFSRLEAIKGIVYRKDGSIAINDQRPFIKSLDSLPPPDLDLLRVKWSKTNRAVMLTSRGCPFKCRFCASSKFWDRTRLHSPAYIINEMRIIAERYHVREILIYDDFFTIDRKRIAEIAELKVKDPLLRKIRIECLSRIDVFDETIAINLKKMGVYRISFGIESGCQKTLDYLKNNTITLEQIEKAIDIAKTYRFECVGAFIIGSPYENAEDIEETFSFIEKMKLDSVQIAVATPFPGTELWEDGKKIGRIPNDEWSDDYYVLYEFPSQVEAERLLKNKILLTQLDREKFFELLRKAYALAHKTNYNLRNFLKLSYRIGMDDLPNVPRKIINGIRYINKINRP